MKIVSVFILGLACVMSPRIMAAEPEPPQGSVALTSDELVAELKGNTFSHASGDNRTRSIYFNGDVANASWQIPNGYVKSAVGPWHAKGSSFCMNFPSGEECHQVRRAGNALYAKFKQGWIPLSKN
jgi:hypothetical protein